MLFLKQRPESAEENFYSMPEKAALKKHQDIARLSYEFSRENHHLDISAEKANHPWRWVGWAQIFPNHLNARRQ